MKKMTEGEKRVWAATFAAYYRTYDGVPSSHPRAVLASDEATKAICELRLTPHGRLSGVTLEALGWPVPPERTERKARAQRALRRGRRED